MVYEVTGIGYTSVIKDDTLEFRTVLTHNCNNRVVALFR